MLKCKRDSCWQDVNGMRFFMPIFLIKERAFVGKLIMSDSSWSILKNVLVDIVAFSTIILDFVQ